MKKITDVETLNDHSLICTFNTGEKRLYEMENEMTGVFSYLKDTDNFKSVTLVRGALTWFRPDACEIDICPDYTYMNSSPYEGDFS